MVFERLCITTELTTTFTNLSDLSLQRISCNCVYVCVCERDSVRQRIEGKVAPIQHFYLLQSIFTSDTIVNMVFRWLKMVKMLKENIISILCVKIDS